MWNASSTKTINLVRSYTLLQFREKLSDLGLMSHLVYQNIAWRILNATTSLNLDICKMKTKNFLRPHNDSKGFATIFFFFLTSIYRRSPKEERFTSYTLHCCIFSEQSKSLSPTFVRKNIFVFNSNLEEWIVGMMKKIFDKVKWWKQVENLEEFVLVCVGSLADVICKEYCSKNFNK